MPLHMPRPEAMALVCRTITEEEGQEHNTEHPHSLTLLHRMTQTAAFR